MATVCVVQSRLTSSRLPGKALLEVAGRPMVVLAAARAGNTGLPVVVATSTEDDDDLIARVAAEAGLQVTRGPLDDALARFVLATRDYADADVVVRLTADNVFPDGMLVQQLAESVSATVPYVRVGGDDRSVPYGIAGEAFRVSALRTADAATADPSDREHVTPWIRREFGDRTLSLADVSLSWRGLRCTVDTLDDFVRVASLFATVTDPVNDPWQDLCDRLARTTQAPVLEPPVGNPLGQGPLVLGTVQLGMPYGAANTQGLPSPEQARVVLRAAADQGVTHVDTARAYELSEQRIGNALARGLSEHLGVVTKVRPLSDLPADADPRWEQEAVDASVATSLRQLRTSSVDALLAHRAADWLRPGVRSRMVVHRESGTCRLVGASLSTPAELLTLLRDEEVGYVQLPFNLLDRRWLGPEVRSALADRPDVVVTVRSVYLQGLLVGGVEAGWPRAAGVDPPAIVAELDALVDDLGRASRADLCLAYVLGHPWVTSVVVGAESPRQVADSATLARRDPLAPAEIHIVEDRLPAGPPSLIDPSTW